MKSGYHGSLQMVPTSPTAVSQPPHHVCHKPRMSHNHRGVSAVSHHKSSGVQGLPMTGGNGGRMRVYSILDKIRFSSANSASPASTASNSSSKTNTSCNETSHHQRSFQSFSAAAGLTGHHTSASEQILAADEACYAFG